MKGLVWRSAGESHGACLIGIVEGVPAGLDLDVEWIDRDLARRQRGYGRGGRMRIETDRVELLSGIKGGVTLGSPIAFRVANKDHVIERLPVPGDPRPGHADLAGCQKFGHRDPRAVLERASARETAVRVAAAGIARQVLHALDVEVFAHTVLLGGVEAATGRFAELDRDARHATREASDFLSLDPEADEAMRGAVDEAKSNGDTLGGVFEVVATGLPPGLGGYGSADERLTGRVGGALFSIPAIKGVEFGLGFGVAETRGSGVHDPIVPAEGDAATRYGRSSNRAGGLEGGMTTGEELVVRCAMKPIPTLRQGMPSVDFESGETVRATWQRSDVTSVPAAGVVGEAMVALTLADAALEKFGADSMRELADNAEAYRRRMSEV